MCHSYRKFAAIALCLVGTGYGTHVLAVAFGDSVHVDTQTISCSIVPPPIATLPLTVDASSRIFVTVTGTAYNTDASVSYHVEAHVELHDATDTTILASTMNDFTFFDLPNADTHLKPYGTSTILYDVSNPTTPFAATAGNYILKLYFESDFCTGTGAKNQSGTLSYLLLSSALDRIFANGFSMAVGDDWAARLA